MADTPQVTYEHTNGNTLSIWTDNLTVEYKRPTLQINPTVDGGILVTDRGAYQRIFSCSGIIDGSDIVGAGAQDWDSWLTGSIDYTEAYPRLTKVYLDTQYYWENIEVAITQFQAKDLGNGKWRVNVTFVEKTK